ncbi:unnamed protein product [Mytilus edulis]|uniref:OTU domain-containing protein n=1 Tax=Mytilus edulis TaxID=6550 RepID=A0A8S3U8Y4_MYTED|nr:unnamed protein product [Mytilus edulis]
MLNELVKQVCDEKCTLTWYKWDTITRKDGTKITSKKGLKCLTGSGSELIAELKKELTELSIHLFVATWQHRQFSHIISNLQPQMVVMVLDFGQNYTCFYQDEAQSAHWSAEQVTVHPSICYYKCKTCSETVKEDIVMLSGDLKHDLCWVVKSAVTRAVKARQALVTCPEEMYKFCTENLTKDCSTDESCIHNLRTFISITDIDRKIEMSAKTVQDLSTAETFEELKVITDHYSVEINNIQEPCPLPNISLTDLPVFIDADALQMIPNDIPEGNFMPVVVKGDGNCLLKSAAVLAYGNEEAQRIQSSNNT